MLKINKPLEVTKPAQYTSFPTTSFSRTLIRINLAGELYSKLREKCGLKQQIKQFVLIDADHQEQHKPLK